jgi:serine/threonine protein kinase
MANPPARIGPYEVLSHLGTGGMAETYLAVRRGPGDFVQHVCLKRIRPDLERDPQFVQQFMTEAAIAARLRHNAITQVLDFGQAGDDYYLALELVDGLDLRQLLEATSASLEPELVLYIAIELASALDFAHRAGGSSHEAAVVHRDVSASNVLLSTEGEVKLSDFGIARVQGGQRHTRTGTVKGKIVYMAPEYARSGRFDPRCDLYALGVLLYECACGELPHEGATELETLELAARGDHPPLTQRAPAVPEAFARIIEQLLAPNPEQRFERAALLLDALHALPSPPRARLRLGTLVAEAKRARATSAAAAASRLPSLSGLGPTQPMPQSAYHASASPGSPTTTRVRSSGPADADALFDAIPGLRSSTGRAKRVLAFAVALAVAVLGYALFRSAGIPAALGANGPGAAGSAAAARKQASSSDSDREPASADANAAATPAPSLGQNGARPRARTASLEVVVLPYGEVTVDGHRIGLSPVTLALEPGEHQIQARNRDGNLERRISLAPGEKRQVVLR